MPQGMAHDSAFSGPTEAPLLLGFTQIQLAERIGSTQGAISHYETVADLLATVVLKLSKALKMSADELLDLTAPRRLATARLTKTNTETKRLWKKFQQLQDLPEKDKRAVIRLINSLMNTQTKKAN